jgi:hypothetical protein
VNLQNQITQKIWKYEKSRSGKIIRRIKPIGILTAGRVEGTNAVAIGFSLCHKNDIFDRNLHTGRKDKKFGQRMATVRAARWLSKNHVDVPQSINNDLNTFIERCIIYYKHNVLPTWVLNRMSSKELFDEKMKIHEEVL